MDKKQQTTQTYNQNAKDLQSRYQNVGVRKKDIELTFSFCPIAKPSVLELGCAYGREAKEILKRTPNYLGIDIAEAFIKLAQKDNPTGKFLTADMETFQFPKNLDIIFAFASMLHCDRKAIKNILDRASNSLNDGGLFFISLKYGDHREVVKKDEYGTRTFYYYTPEDIKSVAANYQIINENICELRGQEWFDLILQKPS